MTLSTTSIKIIYNGNGTTTNFAVPFVFFGDTEIEVVEKDVATGLETTKILNADYTLSGGDGTTGAVLATAPPPSGRQWLIRRKTARLQLADYTEGDAFPAQTHERALDRLTALSQEQDEEIGRALRLPKSDLGTTLLPGLRANKAVVFDVAGNVTVSADDYNDQLANVTAQASAAASSASAAAGSATAASGSARLCTQ